MLPSHVALISQSKSVSVADLTNTAAAVQKQIARDFAPVWTVNATISVFASRKDVPIGYWVVTVCDDTGDLTEGVHKDEHGQPYSLVQYADTWTMGVSHECLEMLADPFCCRVVAGQSPKSNQGRVAFLVEICDPCQDPAFSYTVNGVTVSDFITPQFFDPVQAQGVRYSQTGKVAGPRQVLKNGYLSWHDLATNHWWQMRFFGPEIDFADLGVIRQTTGGLREAVDSVTPRAR